MQTQSYRANDCFDELVDRFGNQVWRIAYARVQTKADADDVFQNVFLLLFQKNPTFLSNDHCRNWLVNVTLKCCKKLRHSSWSRRVTPVEDFPVLQTTLGEESLELLSAVMALPPHYRTAIWLYHYEGYSAKEIAAMTKQKEATVRSQLKRGREKLKGALQ